MLWMLLSLTTAKGEKEKVKKEKGFVIDCVI